MFSSPTEMNSSNSDGGESFQNTGNNNIASIICIPKYKY